MNERIQKLAEQAELNATLLFNKDKLEKFAELIIEECGEIAYNTYWDNPESVRGIHIKEKIKQHFGVEE